MHDEHRKIILFNPVTYLVSDTLYCSLNWLLLLLLLERISVWCKKNDDDLAIKMQKIVFFNGEACTVENDVWFKMSPLTIIIIIIMLGSILTWHTQVSNTWNEWIYLLFRLPFSYHFGIDG